ncbi:peptidylprolyl isomerase [Sphingosinicella rhizophila]|uniref:Peptidyl-prolyl cis-trans isomerase n=1 Tax=Sphingosinicella rhizophila TaxID=3050082 RepID=A0ABU3Q4H3_9SPHN|nr:peptidylprolyl isomerase [Sphingosinicella sp. GR2756]MDT9598323.1 peptidylprolyl isomerase [Sphingosinicella sp. GR2756]
MRLKSVIAALTAIFFANALAAQAVPNPAVPPPAEPENILNLDLSTGGRVSIQLRPDVAPAHVDRIKTLARRGFYNGLVFHRVIDGFMAQGGDPKGDGTGGSDLPDLNAEFNVLPHVRGVLSAARADDANSANSQFFIMLAPRMSLDGKYTVFGRVVSGMNFVDAIERGEPPANPTKIVRASIGADNVPALSAAELQAAAAPPPAPTSVLSIQGAATTPPQ